MVLDEKYAQLKSIVAGLDSVAVAFSGGVDSSFLAKVCHDVLGERSAAVTVVSAMLPQSEVKDAEEVAAWIGIRHHLLRKPELGADILNNTVTRCYFCKKSEFGDILKEAAALGYRTVADGSNADDEGDYRPGLNAIRELKVRSPLREAGLTKQDIRDLSRRLELKTWDKPAMACLASRIPYGERITDEKLGKIERSEDYLRHLGLRQFRVRGHGDIARIEVDPEEREKLFDADLMDRVSRQLKAFGFLYVCLELEGYRQGSLNAKVPAAAGARR